MLKENNAPNRKSLRAIGVTLLVYALLVATHLGEFWPFSIYPMFSQAGRPWSRAIVRDVTEVDSLRWETVAATDLPGNPIGATDYGVDPIDLANFISKTIEWDDDRVAGLRTMFLADRLEDRRVLVLRARGEIDSADSVHVVFTPYVVVDAAGAELNPELR